MTMHGPSGVIIIKVEGGMCRLVMSINPVYKQIGC